MLCLNRREGESIRITDADGKVVASIEVLEIRRGAGIVRLGVTCPQSLGIARHDATGKLQAKRVKANAR